MAASSCGPAIHPVRDFAATGGVFVVSMRTGGLYVSSDSGRTWDRVPGMLADGFFAAVAPSNEPGVIFAASATEGLYKVEWPGSRASGAGLPGRSQGNRPRSGKSAQSTGPRTGLAGRLISRTVPF